MIRRLVIGGTGSGAGKTTIATGLMAALARRGLQVQGFKVGPDYIDPAYHTSATGRPSRNLDSWMCEEEMIPGLFCRSARSAEIAVIEGVMGLFDGASPVADTGSTARVARLLRAPVVLVADAGGVARSAAALVQGFARFDPEVRVAGVIFNNLGGEGHYRLLCQALAAYCPEVRPLGFLPKADGIRRPERHLGLVPSVERGRITPWLAELAGLIEATVDVQGILALAGEAPSLDGADPIAAAGAPFGGEARRVAIARDEAFHFYYEDGLDVLRALGAELIAFSPLRDERVPECDVLYLGGGFPEVYREQLAANLTMQASVRAAHAAGMAVYAECGGLMYLCQAITDRDGAESTMCGLLPAKATMQERFAGHGYAEGALLADCLIGRAGDTVRGHKFHWSTTGPNPTGWPPAFRLKGYGAEQDEGFVRPGLLASYLHLHFAACPEKARRLLGGV